MVKIADLKAKIILPDKVTATLENDALTIKGEKGTVSRVFSNPKVSIKIDGKTIEIHCKNARRKEKSLVGTFEAHIRNMIDGVTKGFTYKMKTVFSHFPIKTAVEGSEFLIHNFLGERFARRAKIIEGVKIEIKGEDITVTGIDLEKVGQTVANIETATRVKNRDVRVFQDGVYLVSRGGK